MFSWSLPPPAAATTQSLGARMLLHMNWTQQIRAPNASSKHPRRIASGRGLLAQSKNKVDFLTTIPDTMTALLSHEMILTSLSPMNLLSNLDQDLLVLGSYMWSPHNPWVPKPKALSSPNVAVKVTSLSQGWVVWVVAAITILVMVLLKVMDVVIIVIVVPVFNMPKISEKDASIGMLCHFVRHKKISRSTLTINASLRVSCPKVRRLNFMLSSKCLARAHV